jgi:hypothetical protein
MLAQSWSQYAGADDFEIAVVAVGLAGEQRVELAAGDFFFQLGERGFGLGDGGGVLLRLAERDQLDIVGKLLVEALEAIEPVAERGALLHQLGAALRVVPQRRVLGEPVQLDETLFRAVDVKATSSAALGTA